MEYPSTYEGLVEWVRENVDYELLPPEDVVLYKTSINISIGDMFLYGGNFPEAVEQLAQTLQKIGAKDRTYELEKVEGKLRAAREEVERFKGDPDDEFCERCGKFWAVDDLRRCKRCDAKICIECCHIEGDCMDCNLDHKLNEAEAANAVLRADNAGILSLLEKDMAYFRADAAGREYPEEQALAQAAALSIETILEAEHPGAALLNEMEVLRRAMRKMSWVAGDSDGESPENKTYATIYLDWAQKEIEAERQCGEEGVMVLRKALRAACNTLWDASEGGWSPPYDGEDSGEGWAKHYIREARITIARKAQEGDGTKEEGKCFEPRINTNGHE